MDDQSVAQARQWAENADVDYPIKCGYLTLIEEIERLRKRGRALLEAIEGAMTLPDSEVNTARDVFEAALDGRET